MIDDFGKIEQFTEGEAIEIVLEDHPDLRLLWERRHLVKSPVEINKTNPVLHILLESIIENQILKNDPPETKLALKRLMENGMSRHAARTAIVSVFIKYLFNTLKNQISFDKENYSRQLRLLGRKINKVGRNDPCPCGSGKKFKHCCIEEFKHILPMQGGMISQIKANEKLILGAGHYATLGYLRKAKIDDPILLLENRAHVSAFLEENGDIEGAYMALKENIAFVESLGDEKLTRNAYTDLLFLCQNNPELAEEGIEVIEKLLPLSSSEEERGELRCDRADFLEELGKIDEAESEYESIFKDMPEWYFGQYRYALFLENIGRKNEAIEVLKQLKSIGDKLDRFIYDAVVEALEDMT
ncbi:MAG: DUF1841 family protein [Firmicutes bacterium]|nr:DUF1841 family protein [Bacillota bacterium]